MEPPEETKQPTIQTIGAIADAGDMATFHSNEEHFAAIERLRPRDPCFIRRASGSFTYARILSRGDQEVVVQVDERGAKKSIPLIQNACTRYIGLPKQTRTVTISRRGSAPGALRRSSISRATNLPKKADSLRSVHDNRVPTRRGISRVDSRRSSVSDARGLHQASFPAGGFEILEEMLLSKPEDQAEQRHDRAHGYKPARRRRPPEYNKTSQLEDHLATEFATQQRREKKRTDDDKTILSLFEMKKQPSPDLHIRTDRSGKQHSPREKSHSPDCASAINSRFNSESHMDNPTPIGIDEGVNRLEINC